MVTTPRAGTAAATSSRRRTRGPDVRVPAVPVTMPLDPDDRRRMVSLYEARLIDQDSEKPGYAETFTELATFLLSLGGHLVVPPMYPDGMVRRLLVDGLRFSDVPLTV